MKGPISAKRSISGNNFSVCFREKRSVHENVLDAGEFRIEPGAQLEQCCDSTVVVNVALGRIERSRYDLQQRRFAAAVGTDDASCSALFDFKRDVFERPEFFMPLQTSAGERLFQAIRGRRIDAILLGNVIDAQRGAHG